MASHRPASTVTTASGRVSSDNTLHPWENRVLSPLECAALQTFPDGFAWGDALAQAGHTAVRDMIGEAVPPHFTRLHGTVIAGLLKQRLTSCHLMDRADTRHIKAQLALSRSRQGTRG